MARKARVTTKVTPTIKRTKTEEVAVFIDYPQQDEGITSAQYTFRIGTAPQADKVEVSIDRGPWLACRQADGFWWYDWSNYTPGVHRLTARGVTTDGKTGMSLQRRFQVLA
jgi:hypothetical protein